MAAIPAPSTILIEPIAGRLLLEKHGNALRHPASLTKLITLFVIFHGLRIGRYRLTDTFRVPEAATRCRGSRLGCAPGTELSIDAAIAALAVVSANDVALAVAHALAGSVHSFVGVMNQVATKLGLASSRFATPHGLDAQQQFTCAVDMARLARSVYVEFPEHRHYFGRRSLTFQGSTKANTNHLLPVYSGMNGLKTGRTYGSGFHLIGSAERGGDHLIAVVMGCGSKSMRDRTTAGLLDLGFGRPLAETGAQ